MRSTAFFSGFFLTLLLLIIGSAVLLTVTAPERFVVLIVGSDQRGTERSRSDVLFLVTLPKSGEEKPFFLTIPRDTKIEHDEFGLQKITHFYALGERPDDGKQLGNIDLTKSVVEELLDVDIDASLEVTFGSFQTIVTTLGGGTIDGALISGEEALALIRDRFSDGRTDFDRQADAREIFRSLLTKVRDPKQLKEVISVVNSSPEARLHYDRFALMRFLIGAGVSRRGKLTIGEMEEGALPGSSGRIYTPAFGKELYYWIPDVNAIAELRTAHFE